MRVHNRGGLVLNLRQLEYFLAVAQAGSFTAASARVGVAQPTLTKSIRLLEQELGVVLFERLARGVVVTLSGSVLQRHAERLGVQVQDAVDELKSMAGGTAGTVRIGAGPAWLRRNLPDAVARIVETYPTVRVNVIGGFDDVLLRSLRAGDLDFVVAELPSEENARDLDLRPLTSDRLCVCAREGHPLAGRGAVPAKDLLAHPWVMPPQSTRAQQRLTALFVALDLPPPRIVVETESMAFLLRLVALSDALTFTVSTTMRLPEAVGVVEIDVPGLSPVRSAGVITRQGAFLSQAAGLVIGELRRICAADGRN